MNTQLVCMREEVKSVGISGGDREDGGPLAGVEKTEEVS